MAKPGYIGPVPWDMVVFFSITAAGFGYSVSTILSDSNVLVAPEEVREVAQSESISVSGSTIDLGCIERKLRQIVTSDGRAVRVRGKFCNLTAKMMKRLEGMRVRNLSTGDEGTMFIQGSSASFVTDDVKLKPGRNIIQVEWKHADSAPRVYITEVYEK